MHVSTGSGKRTQGSEEPPVLAARVPLLQSLLDGLLGVLALGDLLEGIGSQGALQALELEGVTGGHQVVVVDDLDEGLDLGALLLAGLGHAAGNLGRVALDAGHQSVTVGVRLVASVHGLDDHDLFDGNSPVSISFRPRDVFAVSICVLLHLRSFFPSS